MKENSYPIGENSTLSTREILDPAILNYALQSGIINVDAVRQCYEMNERKKYLELHPYSIWEGKDGKWRTYLPDENGGRVLKKRSTEDGIKAIVIEFWKDKENVVTLETVFTEWNDRRLECKKISDATHLRNQQVFNRHYGSIKDRDIKSCDAQWMGDFLEREVSRLNLKAKAFSNLKSITRGMMKRAKKLELLTYRIDDVIDDLEVSDKEFQSSAQDDEEQVFDENDLPLVINYLLENRDILNLAVLFMVVTGCRVGEVVTLKNIDFQKDGSSFYVSRTETRYKGADKHYLYAVKERPKTPAGMRTVIIPSDYHWLYESIRSINPFEEYLFVVNGKRMNTQQVRRRMYKICRDLGIKKKSPHKARKTYCSILLDNNAGDKFIEQQVGHTDVATTKQSYYKNRKTNQTKQNILDGIKEFKIAQ